LSGAQFINTLIQGFFGLISAISTAFSQIPENFVTILGIVTKAEFWAGVGLGLLSAAQKFAAVINGAAASLLEALAKVPGLGAVGGLASGFRDTQASLEASSAQNASASSMNLEGPLAALRDRMAQNFDEIIANVSTTMEGIGETIDTTELQAARDGLVGEITTQMEANRQAVRSQFNATKTQTPILGDEDGEGVSKGANGESASSQAGVVAQSLQSVGGGGNFARFSNRKEIMDSMKMDTSKPGFLNVNPLNSNKVPQFPNVASSGDIAAQHLREAQKQTGILQRIFDKIAPAPTGTLMPA
jgi:hypothetical protein